MHDQANTLRRLARHAHADSPARGVHRLPDKRPAAGGAGVGSTHAVGLFARRSRPVPALDGGCSTTNRASRAKRRTEPRSRPAKSRAKTSQRWAPALLSNTTAASGRPRNSTRPRRSRITMAALCYSTDTSSDRQAAEVSIGRGVHAIRTFAGKYCSISTEFLLFLQRL